MARETREGAASDRHMVRKKEAFILLHTTPGKSYSEAPSLTSQLYHLPIE